MLAYYIEWHMKQRLTPLFRSDGRNKKRKWTFDIERLKSIRREAVSSEGSSYKVVSSPDKEQQKY